MFEPKNSLMFVMSNSFRHNKEIKINYNCSVRIFQKFRTESRK